MELQLGILILFVYQASAQDVLWAWLSGNSHGDQPTSKNNPGSRSGSAVWREKGDLIWLFGGEVYNKGTKHQELTNDLWTFNITSNLWHQVHPGSKTDSLSADNPLRAPSARKFSASCGVLKEVFLLYGGFGNSGALGDTWLYDMKKKKWLPLSEMYKKGSDIATKSSPSARGDMASWCLHDKLVIFGGEHQNEELLDDQWDFSLVNLNWSKAKSYEKLPDNSIGRSLMNYPKGRSGAATAANGAELFMFGGKVKSNIERRKNSKIGYSSDFWIYNVKSDRWSLKSGHEEPGYPGIYGKLGHSDKQNVPGCRHGASGLVDWRGGFWLFGGEGIDESPSPSKHLSDFWHYDKEQKMWAWMGGSKVGNHGGKYGNQGENVADAYPGARTGSVSWMWLNSFYIYGGVGHDTDNKDGILSDLWRIDVHNVVEYSHTAYAGTIFMIVFMFLGLTILAVASFMYTRKFFQQPGGKSRNPYDVEYAPLTATSDI